MHRREFSQPAAARRVAVAQPGEVSCERTRHEQIPPSRRIRLVASGAIVCLVYLVALVATAQSPRHPTIAVPIKIDPSEASIAELMTLDGVGRVRAEQIVLHRVREGPFRVVDDLLNVDGIGVDTLKNIREFLRIGATGDGPPGK